MKNMLNGYKVVAETSGWGNPQGIESRPYLRKTERKMLKALLKMFSEQYGIKVQDIGLIFAPYRGQKIRPWMIRPEGVWSSPKKVWNGCKYTLLENPRHWVAEDWDTSQCLLLTKKRFNKVMKTGRIEYAFL